MILWKREMIFFKLLVDEVFGCFGGNFLFLFLDFLSFLVIRLVINLIIYLCVKLYIFLIGLLRCVNDNYNNLRE